MADIDITKLITASGGKLFDEFSDFLEKKSLIAQGEQKHALKQHSHDSKALARAIAAADAKGDSYRINRVSRQRERSSER